MIDKAQNHISSNIKAVYRLKIITPFVYIGVLIALWMIFPLSEILFPNRLDTVSQLKPFEQEGSPYVKAILTDLYFTGYTSTRMGQTTGYYYYTVWDDTCIFVLLTPNTCKEGLPLMEKVHINARIQKQDSSFDPLAEQLAEDLKWTPEGIKSKISPYIISEPAFGSLFFAFLLVFYFASGVYAILAAGVYALYILFPVFSPPCRQLGRYGKPALLLAQAEEELATLPQLATEDMFITEHFFIEIATTGIAIVPIQEMVWIYKHSTLHKIFWYHFSISYTLHITANRHLHIHCPKNIKSDIDGIIDYLAEANHDILVGFSEDNRIKVQEMQHTSLKFEKLIALLKHRM